MLLGVTIWVLCNFEGVWSLHLSSKYKCHHRASERGILWIESHQNFKGAILCFFCLFIYVKLKCHQFQVPLNVLRGPIVDELHQAINPWISQVIFFRWLFFLSCCHVVWYYYFKFSMQHFFLSEINPWFFWTGYNKYFPFLDLGSVVDGENEENSE